MMKAIGIILGFLFIFISACTVDSISLGGCDEASCYEIKHLPANWRSSSSFSPDGQFEQTFSGPEGSIYVAMSPSNRGQTVPDLAQEYINHLPGDIVYTEEVVHTPHGDMILIRLERPHESGEACFAVLPHVDGQPVIAKGYPENAQTRQLCEIFHKSMPTYTITMASDKSD